MSHKYWKHMLIFGSSLGKPWLPLNGALNLNLSAQLVSESSAMMGMYKRDGSCDAESEIDGRKSSRWRRKQLKTLQGLVERQRAAGLWSLGVQWITHWTGWVWLRVWDHQSPMKNGLRDARPYYPVPPFQISSSVGQGFNLALNSTFRKLRSWHLVPSLQSK